jgi:Tfp pilus assembly protein PilF
MFPAWSTAGRSVDNRNEQIAVPAVVVKLASQADAQIQKSNWQAASDTLERLLRIEPEYAPGWSRMAWLALRDGDAERSRQMAARSNSYAAGRIDLKLLNWGFIRDASIELNDRMAQQRAERNLEALGNM